MVETATIATSSRADEDIDDELACGCREACFGFCALEARRDRPWPVTGWPGGVTAALGSGPTKPSVPPVGTLGSG